MANAEFLLTSEDQKKLLEGITFNRKSAVLVVRIVHISS